MADLRFVVDVDGTGEVKALNKEMGEVPNRAKRAGASLDQFGDASLRATRKTKRFAAVGLQQVGYQVGDFAVQVQGGTNAFVAFGQQGSQMLGILGPLGAVAGALLAIFTAFAAAMSKNAEETGKLNDEFLKLKGQLEPLVSVAKNLLVVLREMAYDTINVLANNLQLVISYTIAATALWAGKAGFTAAITLATLAMTNFGKIVKTVMRTTVIGIAVVALGQFINMVLQLREATGSWGEAFGLVGNVIKAFFSELDANLINASLAARRFISQFTAYILDGLADLWDRFSNWIAMLQAKWDQLGQALGNSWNVMVYGLAVTFDTFVDGVLEGLQTIIDTASQLGILLPGAMKTALRATSTAIEAVQGRSPELPTIGVRSFDSFLEDRMQGVGTTSDRLRGAAQGMRNIAEGLKGIGAATPQTDAALSKLREALDSVAGPEVQFDIRNIMTGFGDKAEEEVEKATKALEDFEKKLENIRTNVAKQFATTLVDSFRSVVDGTMSVGDAFKQMSIKIIQQILNVLIYQPLIQALTNAFLPGMGTGLFGAATSFLAGPKPMPGIPAGGSVRGSHMFADGGVIGSPTYFGMANGGMGVMGEAGPEAILPLVRGANGKLGVQGGGNVTVQQNFNFAANGDDSVKKIIAEAAPGIAKMTEAQIVNSRQRGGQMRRVFN